MGCILFGQWCGKYDVAFSLSVFELHIVILADGEALCEWFCARFAPVLVISTLSYDHFR